MTTNRNKPTPPTGCSRLLWRAPIWIYRFHLGGLLGGRFLLLNHIGRKSGLPRQAVLEVVNYDKKRNIYTLASGFGKKSDWYQNLMKSPKTTIQVGWKKMAIRAVPLTPEESGQAMVDYARRNPKAAKNLMRVIGYTVDGSDEAFFDLAKNSIPFIDLTLIS